MKILHIINSLGAGGAEKLLEESLPLIKKDKNHNVEILTLTDDNNVFDNKIIENNIVLNVSPIKSIYNPLNIFYIRNRIIKGNYDIVHVHLFPSNYWASLAAKLIFRKKPIFFITEHSTYNRRREKRGFKIIEKFIYSSFNKKVSISPETQANLLLWLNPNPKRREDFVIIENGVDVKKYQLATPYKKDEIRSEFTNETKILIMVGSFTPQKDQSTLIKAMSNLSENIHLLLIGEGPLKNDKKSLVKKLELEQRVHFLGFRNDVDRLIKSSDIIVLSSNWEGFGLAAVEGMAAEKPVIASNVAGLKEIVEGSGIVFEKGNNEELSKIITNLISDEKQYLRMSYACTQKANQYSIEKMVQKHLDCYGKSLK